jgi:hypothetical protein
MWERKRLMIWVHVQCHDFGA